MKIALTSIPYGSFSNYSPRGLSELSQRSRKLCGAVKAGRPQVILSVFDHLRKPEAQVLYPFINKDATLVPVPRSAPLREGALWPAKVIADFLCSEKFGKEVFPSLTRVSAVQKSSSQLSADTRPSVEDHYNSLKVLPELLAPSQITLIDDVLTLGRTAFACALRLKEAFPEAEIKVFALIRTQGLVPDIEKIVDPSVGTITYNQYTGKTNRNP